MQPRANSSDAPAVHRLPHQPALDGLRGLAVAAVVAYHLSPEAVPGGFLGVSAFFTLSGFLITGLLLAEWRETGRIDLARFWSRRARRLLPAALLALGGIIAFGALVATPDQVAALRSDVLAALGYVANWRFVATDTTYGGLTAAPSPVQHFWSLAIEEQFYVVFPLLVAGVLGLVVRRRRGPNTPHGPLTEPGRDVHRRVLGLVLAGLAAASLAAMVLLGASTVDRRYFGTDTRAFELLAGAMLAVVIAGQATLARRWRPVLVGGGVLALAAGSLSWFLASETTAFLYAGGLALHAVGTSVIIWAAVLPGGAVRSLLSLGPLQALGRISYGVYLFHWPILLWLTPDRTGIDGVGLAALRIAVTLVAALLSYRLVEVPVRTGQRLVAWRPWLVGPATATAVVLAVVAVTVDPPPVTTAYADVEVDTEAEENVTELDTSAVSEASTASASGDIFSPSLALGLVPVDSAEPGGAAPSPSPSPVPSEPVPPEAPAVPPLLRPDAPGTVLVIGDSVTFDALHGIRAALEATGSVATLVDSARFGFGLEANDFDWRGDFTDLVAEHQPDLIIAFWGSWDLRVAQPEPERYRSMVLEASDLLTAGGAKVVWVGMLPSAVLDPYEREDTNLVNGPFSELPERRPDAITYVDPDPIFAPGGLGSRVERIERSPLTGSDELLRTPDHRHLCPAGSAIVAYLAAAAAVAEGWLTPAAGTWWEGSWTADERFYDRVGGCERA
ncbi:acyltransferase family protein [soil metagenome]